MKNLALCRILLTSKGYLEKIDAIEVDRETDKTIFTKDYKKKKFAKQTIGKVKTHFKNEVHSDVAVVGFYCLCYEDEVEATTIALKLMVIKRVEKLREGVQGLLDGLKIDRNENNKEKN